MLLSGVYGGRWAVLLLAHRIKLTAQPSFVRCVAVGVMAGVRSCLASYLAGGSSACTGMQRLDASCDFGRACGKGCYLRCCVNLRGRALHKCGVWQVQ
jgi:hypothetical protein